MESAYLAHWMSSNVIPASPFRKKAVLLCTDGSLMMLSRIGFHACVWIFAVKTVKDTQCGFKVPQSLHLLFSPFLFHNFDWNKISQFSFSCWREKLQRFFSTLFTSRDGLLMWRCWRWVSWIYALSHFSVCLHFYDFKVAEMLQIPLGEVSVRWQEIDGSKLSPLLAAIEMFR